jgi:hypothetical protein
MKTFISIVTFLSMGLLINACDDPVHEDLSPQSLNLIEFLAAMPSDGSVTNGKALPRPMVWGDCELFGSVVTNTSFNPDHGNFDELYAGGNGFKEGVGLISDSKPGDQDFNGGRWHMNVLKEGVDPDKYMDACNVEDLDLNDFESTTNYFECPMLPRRGKNG